MEIMKMSKKEEEKPIDLRRERIRVFEDTQEWIENDTDLINSVILVKKNTRVFYENDYPAFNRPVIDEEIAVTGIRSYEAAMRLRKQYPDSKIAVMNFANAFHAGGGSAGCPEAFVSVTEAGGYSVHII